MTFPRTIGLLRLRRVATEAEIKWNAFLLIVSLVLLVLFAGVWYREYLMQAEAVAEDVARHIDVDQDAVRILLEKNLQ